MRRVRHAPRSQWQREVESCGLSFHTLENGEPYWDESAHWEFTATEIDRLEAAAAELQTMCVAAAEHILSHDLLDRMQVPPLYRELVRATWNADTPTIYGRFDLAYDGSEIKLLEYNADTPTSLLEAAVVQWQWLQDFDQHADQWNSIHERLIAKWEQLRLGGHVAPLVHFAHQGPAEDLLTVAYLQDTAEQAGLRTRRLRMEDLGLERGSNRFVDLENEEVRTLFKLYPWEWMARESFGAAVPQAHPRFTLIEPAWKMLWSNKALLAVLWELYPAHPLLLEAHLDSRRVQGEQVAKPVFGREGKGVRLLKTCERWRAEGYVYQARARMASSDGRTAVFGVWMIDGEPAGMGIRESAGPVTDNTSRFVPHRIA